MSQVTRGELEGKLREIQVEAGDAATSAAPAALSIGAAIAAGVVGLAYALGQRKASRQTTVVEIRRT